MSDPLPPKLVEDSNGRMKIEVSLQSGRYQLSLDDSGVILLQDSLNYGRHDVVPDLLVKVLVATGDAWFPNQREYRSVVADLPTTTPASDRDLSGLAEYLCSRSVPAARVDLVRNLVTSSRLSDLLSPDDVAVNELPTPPTGVFDGATDRSQQSSSDSAPGKTGTPKRTDAGATSAHSDSNDYCNDVDGEQSEYTVFEIPGIGETRGDELVNSGWHSVEAIAGTTPEHLVEATGLSKQRAIIAIEGAQELVGARTPTAERLAARTGGNPETYEAVLSQLAAAGVPPSHAEPTLRRIYGPSLVDIEPVDGRMAYFLFEAGYTTTWEIAEATIDELESVAYLGPNTASDVQVAAEQLIDE